MRAWLSDEISPRSFIQLFISAPPGEGSLGPGGRVLLGFDVSPKHGIDAGQMSLPVGFEPVHRIAVQAQMYRGLPGRHDEAGSAPKVGSKGLSLGNLPVRGFTTHPAAVHRVEPWTHTLSYLRTYAFTHGYSSGHPCCY